METVFRVGEVALKPIYGDITTLEADALVQPSGTSKEGWPLQAAPWVVEADQDGSITQALGYHAPLQLGQVIVTPPGPSLKARYLFHAIVVDWGNQHPSGQLIVDEIVQTVAARCIAVGASLDLKTIAFTPWGTRIGAVEPAHVTALLIHSISRALQANPGSLETVYLVSREIKHYQWFVDRAFVFRIVLDQLCEVAETVEMLNIPQSTRDKVLAALQNAQQNIVVYNQHFAGSKYSISVEKATGMAVGDQAEVKLDRND